MVIALNRGLWLDKDFVLVTYNYGSWPTYLICWVFFETTYSDQNHVKNNANRFDPWRVIIICIPYVEFYMYCCVSHWGHCWVFTAKFNQMVYQYPIRIPERFSLVIRSLLTQEGICLTLQPDFKFLEVTNSSLHVFFFGIGDQCKQSFIHYSWYRSPTHMLPSVYWLIRILPYVSV